MPRLSNLTIYVLVSVVLACGVFYQTFAQQHVSFSLALTRLTNSKLNKTIIFNSIFSVLLATVSSLIKFFFGEMREIERYDIIQWTKQKVLSFAFIMIVLHEESFTSHLLGMFVILLAWSIFHWLTIKRSEYLIMENQGNYKGHIKISILFLLLSGIDILLLEIFYESIFVNVDATRSDRHLTTLLGFEVLILLLKIGSPLIKYFINLVELLTLSHFERKSTVLSIIEFMFTITALLSELWFFYFIYQTFGTPLHLILEAIETVMSLVKTTSKFYTSIVLVRKLSKLPNVTEEDIQNIDSTCLICLHEITSGKKIPCGHVFHLNCLKGWIQGNVNQFCPKCKQPIKIENIAESSGDGAVDLVAQFENQNVHTKLEKLNDLNFGLDNLMVMKLYNEILLGYIEKDEKQVEEESHQDIISRIYLDLLENQTSGKDLIGAMEYGLPRPAVSYRSPEAEDLKKKARLVNYLVLCQFGNHAFFKLRKPGASDDRSAGEKSEAPEKAPEKVPEIVPEKPVEAAPSKRLSKGDLSSIFTKAIPKKEAPQEKSQIPDESDRKPIGEAQQEETPTIESEEETLRRRKLFLEALEKRAAQIDDNEKPEDTQETKKTV